MAIRRHTLAAGAIFALAVSGTSAAQAQTYTVLYRFMGPPDGYEPAAGLVADAAGNLFGTTIWGGASDNGTVFKLSATGETLLYSFTGGADGRGPDTGLIRDSAGNLYGTTVSGGYSRGTVFRVAAVGTETVLHRFTGGPDGEIPTWVHGLGRQNGRVVIISNRWQRAKQRLRDWLVKEAKTT
jgi:uncharacterized repeat protein (TIGR03803 family)